MLLATAPYVQERCISETRTNNNFNLATGFSCLNSLSCLGRACKLVEEELGVNIDPFTPNTPLEIRWRSPVAGGGVCMRFPVIVLFPPSVDVVVLVRERAIICTRNCWIRRTYRNDDNRGVSCASAEQWVQKKKDRTPDLQVIAEPR